MAKTNDEFQREYITEEDYENSEQYTPRETQNRRSRRKKSNAKKTAIILTLLLVAGAAGGIGIKTAIDNKLDYNRATSLTGAYICDGGYCIVPDRIFTSQNHDYTVTSGKHITQAADNRDIDVLKIGGSFITEEGTPIARVILEVETVEAKKLLKYENNGQEFYIEPEGYTWNNATQRCERVTRQVVERYVIANPDHNYANVRIPGSTVVSVISYEEYPSISYEEATNMKLIADVNDQYVKNDATSVVEARLVLVPNTQK